MKQHIVARRVIWFACTFLFVLMAGAAAQPAHAGKIYRCVDETGKKVTVSDSPCAYALASPPAGGAVAASAASKESGVTLTRAR